MSPQAGRGGADERPSSEPSGRAQPRYVGVIGARSCPAGVAAEAREVGRLIAEAGWVLVCGGMGGVMEEACRGAREAGGLTVGILPGSSRVAGNPYLSVSVVTGLGEARNVLVVRSSEALIAVSGAYGTLSEIALAGAAGIPVIGLHSWVLDAGCNEGRSLFAREAANPAEAVSAVRAILEGRGQKRAGGGRSNEPGRATKGFDTTGIVSY
jgi:uncharacterized protein (TIGR00725 family)